MAAMSGSRKATSGWVVSPSHTSAGAYLRVGLTPFRCLSDRTRDLLFHQGERCRNDNGVEVSGQLSNQNTYSQITRRLHAMVSEIIPGERPFPVSDRKHRRSRRLSASDVDDLVAGYLAGATFTELGAQFGIHRTTASECVRRRGASR